MAGDIGYLGGVLGINLKVRLSASWNQRDNKWFPACEASLNAPHPKPAQTPYAALNGAAADGREDAGRQQAGARDAAATAADGETARWSAETERLAALKGALWASFQAEPASVVRAPIVDLTMAYTDALRMELKLRAVGKSPGPSVRLAAKTGARGY
ncbi:MAG: hypothetical protein K2X41_04500 [Hyphomicrobium sp.]|nr:hypothetical protein [Hyphomicrobium sp.]